MSTGVVGSSVSFAGPVTFTAVDGLGTLTVTASGAVDITTGNFSTSGPITASTELLAGTTGHLTFVGNENLASGAFTETITGQLCVGGSGRNLMVP